jgi:hypothetical protein
MDRPTLRENKNGRPLKKKTIAAARKRLDKARRVKK